MASPSSTSERFNAIADWLTRALGSLQALVGSVVLVVVWALTGPVFNFSDTWQLFINTTTTVVTFWMVFVIQNSANRESKATQLKLDEIIRALADARNEFIALDRAPEEVLVAREQEFDALTLGNDDGPGGSTEGANNTGASRTRATGGKSRTRAASGKSRTRAASGKSRTSGRPSS